MSLRQVLTIYNAERQLSDDETALLNTLRKMTDAERALFVEQLSDKPQKKSSKKSAGGGGGRSSRGESLKRQISNRAQSAIRPPSTAITDSDNSDDGNTPRCQAKRSDGRICMLQPDHNIHHLATVHDYHQFQPAEQAAATSGD